MKYRKTHIPIEETKIFIEAWQPTIKYLFLFNGGALITILTFVSNILGKMGIVLSQDFIYAAKDAVMYFGCGLFAGMVLSILISLNADLDMTTNDEISNSTRLRIGIPISILALTIVAVSIVCLGLGLLASLEAFGKIGLAR